MDIINEITKEQIKSDITPFGIGDTVRVFVKVVEGNRERLQAFEGIVISRKNAGINETFTVRKISYGVGVERVFPIHSPRIDHIEVIRRGPGEKGKTLLPQRPCGQSCKGKREKILIKCFFAGNVNGRLKICRCRFSAFFF